MDTDSAYFSLSNDSFQSLVSPSTFSHYNCINTSCSNALYVPTLTNPDRWFSRTCGKEHKKFDARTPGLFNNNNNNNNIYLKSNIQCT